MFAPTVGGVWVWKRGKIVERGVRGWVIFLERTGRCGRRAIRDPSGAARHLPFQGRLGRTMFAPTVGFGFVESSVPGNNNPPEGGQAAAAAVRKTFFLR